MIPKASLYDRYRLTNSTAIPQFQGSAGPEAIQVGAHLQGLYDQAQQAGNDVLSMSNNIQAMAADQALAKELHDHVQSTIGKYSEAKDWENRVPEVRSLGQHYINRANELATPVKQYQEWKKTLDDKELNLTPKQKALYDQMALSSYGGLRKDAAGKYVGGFSGMEAAKNLDVNKRADQWIQGYVEAEGGSDITTDNGITKYRKAGTWHVLTPQRIQQILSAARKNDNEYLAYEGMEGSMEGFQVAKNIKNIDQLNGNPVVKQAVQTYVDAGYSLQEAAAKVAATHRTNSIVKTMENYAIGKYAHNNQTSITSQEMGDVAKARAIKDMEDKAGETTITTDTLDNPATNWDDLDKSQGEYTASRKAAGQEINNAKNVVGRWYEQTHGKGSWANVKGNDEEAAIKAYYDGIPGGPTLYAGLQNARQQYQFAENNLRKVAEAKDFVTSFVSNKMGTDPRLIEADNKKAIAGVLNKTPDKKVRVLIDNQWREFTSKELSAIITAPGAKFEKSDVGNTIMPSFLEINSTKFRTADGKQLVIQDNAITGKIDNVVSSQAKYGEKRSREIEKWTKEALDNYSQSTGIVKSSSKKLNDNIYNTIRAGEKVIYDAAGHPITAGTDKEKELQALINNGDFDYLGTYTENKGNQNSLMKISVSNKKDPKAVPETYRIGVTSTNNNMLSAAMMKEAVNKQGQIVDHATYEAALAMRDGSAYNKINRSKLGTVATIKRRVVGTNGKETWETFGQVEKGRIGGKPSVVATRGNQPIPLNDQVSIAAWLESYSSDPNYKVEY